MIAVTNGALRINGRRANESFVMANVNAAPDTNAHVTCAAASGSTAKGTSTNSPGIGYDRPHGHRHVAVGPTAAYGSRPASISRVAHQRKSMSGARPPEPCAS